jgi:hypothetical protein
MTIDELTIATALLATVSDQIRALEFRRAQIQQRIADLTAAPPSREGIPCWTCDSPQAVDVRHVLGVSPNPKAATTLGGMPRGCCRVETFGTISNPL